MKKILITGKNSYIGTSFEKWVANNPEEYQVDSVGTKNREWEEADFSQYDVVFHVAGIAHNSSDPKLKDLYYQVNRDLTLEVAKKAKAEGVKQFIFMSSIIVYGTKKEVIDEHTKPDPDNFYGDSKLQAELGLKPLETDEFKIAIIRPPMIYGKGSKGNYPKLAKLAKITPVFPDFNNKRSMLYINNLCEFIKNIIELEDKGLFFPQNEEYVRTTDMVNEISKFHEKKIINIKLLNPIIRRFMHKEIIKKVFGSLFYDRSLSTYKNNQYQIYDLADSIKHSEWRESN